MADSADVYRFIWCIQECAHASITPDYLRILKVSEIWIDNVEVHISLFLLEKFPYNSGKPVLLIFIQFVKNSIYITLFLVVVTGMTFGI